MHAARFASWLLVAVAELAAAGCPVAVPASQQIAFGCESDSDCTGGQLCRNNRCTNGATDAATAAPDQAAIDRQDRDGATSSERPTDRGAHDSAASEIVWRDTAVSDRPVDDRAPADQRPTDTQLPDRSADREGRDSGVVDRPASDRGAPDAVLDDRTGSDAATSDRADAAAVDDATVDAGGSDRTSADSAEPRCPGTPPASPALCDPANLSLVACFTFDGDGNIGAAGGVHDDSSYRNDGTALGVTYVSGREALAISTAAGGQVQVPDSTSIDVTAGLTLEAWIFPNSLPTSGRMGVFDKDGQWGMFINPPDDLRCSRGNAALGADLDVGVWNHVACVVDSASVRVYHNGVEVAAETYAIQFNSGDSYVAVGSDSPSGSSFDGLIDSVRIWNAARSAGEMCWAAAR